MIGKGMLPSVQVVERLPGSARITNSLAKYRARRKPKPKPAPGPVPAPRGNDVLRTGPDSVELILSYAGVSRRNFRQEAGSALGVSCGYLFFAALISFVLADLADSSPSGAIRPVAALAAGSATLLCYAAAALLLWPRVLRISFAPAARPVDVRVVRSWRTRRIPVSALSGITFIEYRYRRDGETAGGDAQRETISSLPYRIDAVLHRVGGGSLTIRGASSRAWYRAWKPDTRDMYDPLADLLAPAGLVIDRQVSWTQHPVSHGQWFSPGSGGANGAGF
jgi:hypothetical protein